MNSRPAGLRRAGTSSWQRVVEKTVFWLLLISSLLFIVVIVVSCCSIRSSWRVSNHLLPRLALRTGCYLAIGTWDIRRYSHQFQLLACATGPMLVVSDDPKLAQKHFRALERSKPDSFFSSKHCRGGDLFSSCVREKTAFACSHVI